MTQSFILPDLGEGVHEAEILAIPVSVGQHVEEGEVILEIETDKAAVEIPSPYTGTVTTIHVQVGDMATVGSPLLDFDRKPAAAAGPTAAAPGDTKRSTGPDTGRPVPASPSTRRLARELGVDLRLVTPTGTKGIVTAEDVRNHAAAAAPADDRAIAGAAEPPRTPTLPAPAGLPDFTRWGPVTREPFHSIRRTTANQMATSWAQIPHVNCQDSVDITRLEDFRQRHKDEIAAAGGRLTLTLFALKAAATALKHFPHFNASLDLAAGEIVIKNYFHIGVAVDTDHGLMVPVLRDVDRKSIKELAIELQDLITRARKRTLTRDELAGGTFTITNAGALGGHLFAPIINYPEAAILGCGQARMQPTVMEAEDGVSRIAARLTMPIVLCFDHRLVDGADAIRFLRLVISALEDPDELLITMI